MDDWKLEKEVKGGWADDICSNKTMMVLKVELKPMSSLWLEVEQAQARARKVLTKSGLAMPWAGPAQKLKSRLGLTAI